MQLSLLQSRLLASLAASLFVLVLYLFLFSPNFALAAELANQPAIHLDGEFERSPDLGLSYEPEFGLFDRGILGRAPPGVRALGNNAPVTMNVEPGKTECFMVEQSALFSRDLADSGKNSFIPGDDGTKDDGSNVPGLQPRANSWKIVYLSVNTCLQPQVVSSNATSQSPPQLSVYVSNSSEITCPDPTSDKAKVETQVFDEGAVMYKINATGDTYIGVSAPALSPGNTGVYHFEIAASFEEFYHAYDDNPQSQELSWIDSDSNSALLFSRNLTQDYDRANQIMKDGLLYDLYVENTDSNAINGLRRSICGLMKNAQISANRDGDGQLSNLVKTTLTTRGPGGLPKQQFYFMGLNASSFYSGILVKARNRTSGSKRQEGISNGGGTVFNSLDFWTSSAPNCRLVTDLEFCTEIQYAAPGNDDKFNNTALAQAYDAYAREMYSSFEKVLMQMPCEAPADSRYSLARGCDQCKEAYKRWLCTVSIPRCEAIVSNNTAGIPRNVGLPFPNGTKLPDDVQRELGLKPYNNASRNAFIDREIQPGPYKEILPCDDVCYQVVQSCPAAMNFGCPQPHMPSFNVSYGRRDEGGAFTCNSPGEARSQISAASFTLPATLAFAVVPLMMCLML